MRLAEGARIAVVGAGPSGIAAARYALEAGFEVSVFEASDRLGGQWYTAAAHSGVWPGMHTNTSRAMTAFSDLPPLRGHPLHPAAEQIHAYLGDYARTFGVLDRIRFECRVKRVRPGWTVDGEPFDAVVVASGRFCKPRLPAIVRGFGGQLLHSFDYPGAGAFTGRTVLVYGNGISGAEIASDLAAHAPVISAFRKSRYVIQKVVDGVPSDWQWYTLFGALERRLLTSEEWSRRQRERVLRVAGNPADFGVPAPDEDLVALRVARCGISTVWDASESVDILLADAQHVGECRGLAVEQRLLRSFDPLCEPSTVTLDVLAGYRVGGIGLRRTCRASRLVQVLVCLVAAVTSLCRIIHHSLTSSART